MDYLTDGLLCAATLVWPYFGGQLVFSKVLFKTYEVRSKVSQVRGLAQVF